MQNNETHIPVASEEQHNSAPRRGGPVATFFRKLWQVVFNGYCARLSPIQIFWFVLSHVVFYLALYLAVCKTKLHNFSITAPNVAASPDANDDYFYYYYYFHTVVFYTAIILHEALLLELLFYHASLDAALHAFHRSFIGKSVCELGFMIAESLLLIKETTRSGRVRHDYSHAEAAMLLGTYALLNLDALCIVNLLPRGHRYSIIEITAALTVHLCLKLEPHAPCLSWLLVFSVFLIILIKNFLWRDIDFNGGGDDHNNGRSVGAVAAAVG